MTRSRVVIIGAGLGGCMLAHALQSSCELVMVERGCDTNDSAAYPVVDVGKPAVLDPHVGCGLGGSTRLWHNGLIEIDEHVFVRGWPVARAALDGFYERAFEILARVPAERVARGVRQLRDRYTALGMPALDLPGLYYPLWPINVWDELKLAQQVELIPGELVDWVMETEDRVSAIRVRGPGGDQTVSGDIFVLAAGGLGTPVLLQDLSGKTRLPALQHAGFHYEDHPMGFVGEVEVAVPLYKLWNYRVPGTDGNLRMSLVVKAGELDISFQLRPAAMYYRSTRRERVGSVLNELRRQPWNPRHLWKLLHHWDDVLDILSFKFGIHLPTRHYTLLMTAQMPPSEQLAIWRETDLETGSRRSVRRWVLTEDYRADLQGAIELLLQRLAPVLKSSRLFPAWFEDLRTGAHHSGTARMAASAESGVCNADCKVHGMSNLYVCDGSVIPASGIANTGLTIAALALRLGARLRALFDSQRPDER